MTMVPTDNNNGNFKFLIYTWLDLIEYSLLFQQVIVYGIPENLYKGKLDVRWVIVKKETAEKFYRDVNKLIYERYLGRWVVWRYRVQDGASAR